MKTVIEMAKEAGFTQPEGETWYEAFPQCIERFAELVRADEREACAKVCDAIDVEYEGEDVLATWCSQAIRASGNT